MKILAVSDVEAEKFYDYYEPGCLDDYGLILSAGDLSKEYLEFLVTLAHCPLVYIHGNHDESFIRHYPEGCIDADDKVVEVCGLRIMGLGGSYDYNAGEFQYTEREMRSRYRKLKFRMRFKPGHPRGVDILLTHAPVRGHYDAEDIDLDIAHRGFEVFDEILLTYKPKLMVHGHMHRNYGTYIPQKSELHDTIVINADEYCEIEV